MDSWKSLRGQCGVTALVINDLFGGRIVKTLINDQWHYYNWINGQRFDFTRNQFDFEPDYRDLVSNRDEVFSDISEFQYKLLKGLMEKELMGIVDIENAEHYSWGDNCDGWHFVKSDHLSIIKKQCRQAQKRNFIITKRLSSFFTFYPVWLLLR